MLVYFVMWMADQDLAKGKGRVNLKEFMYSIHVTLVLGGFIWML